MRTDMREILFRGQTPYTGEWAYGKLTELKERHGHIEAGYYLSNGAGMPFAFHVSGNTLGQYIGLDAADSNRYRIIKGKKEKDLRIFEGDIVRYALGEKTITCIVKFISFAYIFVEIKTLNEYEPFDAYKKSEIIGNIYDNPELLLKNDGSQPSRNA
jgi:hypothetical protein